MENLIIASSPGLRLVLQTYSDELDYDAIIELLETATKQMKKERELYLAFGHKT